MAKKLLFIFIFLFSSFLMFNIIFASDLSDLNESIIIDDSINNDLSFDSVDGCLSIFSSKWKVDNISKLEDNFHFSDKILASDWFDGPCDVIEEYKEKVDATFNVSVNINVNLLSSELGFSVVKGSEKTRTLITKVNDNEKLNVKVFGNYEKYGYSVYENGNHKCDGFAYKPVGLVFKQYRFSKE